MRITVLTVPLAACELGSDRLMTAGARAIEERDADGGLVELRTVIASVDEVSTARLGPLPDDWAVCFEDVDDAPSEAWRDFVQPMWISDRLVVTPAWCDVADPGSALVVSIEPAGSFGLGDHPTTRLSAAAVDRVIGSGERVLDVGCGSGVLGIIAALRGAVEVIGVDIAEAAVEATRANARRNGVEHSVESSSTHPSDIEGPFGLVVANILAPTLVELSSELRRLTAPSGALVISGVLTGHHDHVLAALSPMLVESTEHLDGWAAVVLRHPSSSER